MNDWEKNIRLPSFGKGDRGGIIRIGVIPNQFGFRYFTVADSEQVLFLLRDLA
jgi:hypothetical protein